MVQRRFTHRGRLALLPALAAVAALALAGVALAGTPTMTIVGPRDMSTPTPAPTAPVAAVDSYSVSLYFADNGWGADYFRLSNDGGATWPWSDGLTSPYQYWWLLEGVTDPALIVDGDHTVTAQFSSDGGATWGPTSSATTLVDTHHPLCTVRGRYWNAKCPYAITATDQVGLSGVQYLWYFVDAGPVAKLTATEPLGTTAPLIASVVLSGDTGTTHTVYFCAQDYAGNYSNSMLYLSNRARAAVGRGAKYYDLWYGSVDIIVDVTPPTVTARGAGKGWHNGPVTLAFTAKDPDAGVAYVQYSITRNKAKKPGVWVTGDSVVVARSGKRKVWYRAADDALPKGNVSAAAWVRVRIR
jgi:hypothetical protein